MQYRAFGKTDITVSEVGLGCWQLGGDCWGQVDDARAQQILQTALDGGVNFFDTADVYGGGTSEQRVGRFVRQCGKRVFVGIRGGWGKAIVLVLIGVWLTYSARWPRPARPLAATGGMSESEARATLGVPAGATISEIQAAYSRLIQVAHPDRGGTDGLAAQLNAARDRLLKG